MQTIQTKSREELEQIVRQEFPAEQFSIVMGILEELKSTSEKHRTNIQFNLASSSRGKIEILRKHIDSSNSFLAQPRQPVPKVARKHVERIVRRDFPSEQFENVMAILDEYGKEKFENEASRVQVDILKLSSGNIDSLRKNVKAAKSDYRDVISWAEYPNYRWDTSKLSIEEQRKICSKDWKQYLDWVNAK
jgi:hypothetical protein